MSFFFFSLSFKIKKLIIFVVGLVIFFFPDFRSNWLAVGFFFFFLLFKKAKIEGGVELVYYFRVVKTKHF